MSRPVPVDLAEVLRRLEAVAQLRAHEHAVAVRRVARSSARLRWSSDAPGQGAPTSREADPVGAGSASTTTTRSGGPSGCSTQSA